MTFHQTNFKNMNRRLNLGNDVFIEITSPKMLTDSEMCDYLKQAIDVISTNYEQIIDTVFFIDVNDIIHKLNKCGVEETTNIKISDFHDIIRIYDKQEFMKILYSDGVIQYRNKTFIIGKTHEETIDRFQKYFFQKSYYSDNEQYVELLQYLKVSSESIHS